MARGARAGPRPDGAAARRALLGGRPDDTRQSCTRELADAAPRSCGMPIVLVTHDLDEAPLLADRMRILHRGRTLQSGPPARGDGASGEPAGGAAGRTCSNVFDGTVAGALTPDGGLARIALARPARWRRAARAGFAPGERVAWAIPPARRDPAPARSGRPRASARTRRREPASNASCWATRRW
ncbi:MAG: hypothetical protein MZW92_39505 [Comamonadaceae bacterium]|nr:hypothetical protein [Comamonadaceae bacterium]